MKLTGLEPATFGFGVRCTTNYATASVNSQKDKNENKYKKEKQNEGVKILKKERQSLNRTTFLLKLGIVVC